MKDVFYEQQFAIVIEDCADHPDSHPRATEPIHCLADLTRPRRTPEKSRYLPLISVLHSRFFISRWREYT